MVIVRIYGAKINGEYTDHGRYFGPYTHEEAEAKLIALGWSKWKDTDDSSWKPPSNPNMHRSFQHPVSGAQIITMESEFPTQVEARYQPTSGM